MATRAQGPVRHAVLEILNCGPRVSKDEISETLKRIGVANFIKIAKGHNEPKCRVTFVSDQEKNAAMGVISSSPVTTDESHGPWKVKSVFVRRLQVKREAEEAVKSKTVVEAVAPWSNTPYEEQLIKKQEQVKQAMNSWCEPLSINDFDFKDIVPSPITREYRNKLDLTIGIDGSGQPCAGFRVGSYKEGGRSSFRVELNDECLLTCPTIGLKVAAHLNDFMRNKSTFQVYDQDRHVGFFRALSIRWSERTKELMVLLRCAGQSTESEKEMERVLDHFRNFEYEGVRITTMLWQWWEGISFQAPLETGFINAFGKDSIEEEVLGMRFRISPGAFFQVNTQGSEKLFTIVSDLVKSNTAHSSSGSNKTLLLDVCCGTGAIGLLCSRSAATVIGVELSAPAIVDARINASQNKLEDKCFFICSKAESVLSRLLTGEAKPMLARSDTVLSDVDEVVVTKALDMAKTCTDIVAVVDPPRAGLHPSVLKALLRCATVTRIIYVSCNPVGSFVENAKVLCGTAPIISQGKDIRVVEGVKPFRPTKFIPVDMFPHTEHCELIAEFVRMETMPESQTLSQSKKAKLEKE